MSGAPRAFLTATLLSVTNFLAVFDGLGVTVALPAIEADLGIDRLDAQWLITAYALSLGGTLLVGGRCGDCYGIRRMLVVGLCVFVAGLLLAGLAPAPLALFLARGIQGVGAGLAVPNTFALTKAATLDRDRHRLLAAIAVAGGAGATSGAIVGGLITQGLGWRFLFLLTVPLATAAAVTARLALSGGHGHLRSAGVNVVDACLTICGLALLVLGITGINRHGPGSAATVGAFALAAAACGAFVARQRHARNPLVQGHVFRWPTFRGSVAGLPGLACAYDGTVFIGLLFVQQVLGYAPFDAGLAFAPVGVAVLAGSALATQALRRYSWRVVVVGAQSACAGALVLLSLATTSRDYTAHFLPGLLLLGLAAAASAISLNGAVARQAPRSETGAVYGIYETLKYLSSTVVIAALATIVSADTATPGLMRTDALAEGYRMAFLAAAVVAFLAGPATCVAGRGHGPPDHERRARREAIPIADRK